MGRGPRMQCAMRTAQSVKYVHLLSYAVERHSTNMVTQRATELKCFHRSGVLLLFTSSVMLFALAIVRCLPVSCRPVSSPFRARADSIENQEFPLIAEWKCEIRFK